MYSLLGTLVCRNMQGSIVGIRLGREGGGDGGGGSKASGQCGTGGFACGEGKGKRETLNLGESCRVRTKEQPS